MKNKNILLIKLFLVVVISPCFISCDRKANGFIYNGYGDIIGWYKKTGDTVTLPKPFRGYEHVEFDIDGNKVRDILLNSSLAITNAITSFFLVSTSFIFSTYRIIFIF